jgi:hypothetical protein
MLRMMDRIAVTSQRSSFLSMVTSSLYVHASGSSNFVLDIGDSWDLVQSSTSILRNHLYLLLSEKFLTPAAVLTHP